MGNLDNYEHKEIYVDRDLLPQINANCDFRELFFTLGLKEAKGSKPYNLKAISPFNPSETKPSFHINKKGWYDFSTAQGGSYIDLVCKIKGLDLYDAARWLIEQGLSGYVKEFKDRGLVTVGRVLGGGWSGSSGKKNQNTEKGSGFIKDSSTMKGKGAENFNNEKKKNLQTAFSLLPYLKEQGTHPEFVRRGISKATCDYLGAGYLARGNGAMDKRIVFQIRGVEAVAGGGLVPVVLNHIGRATTEDQETENGKWWHYPGFVKTLEIFNIDKLLLDPKAIEQVKETGRVVIVEGCFDTAKMIQAGLLNVCATFGAYMDQDQLPRFKLLAERLPVKEFLVFYDRDRAGIDGQLKASLLMETNLMAARGFDWNRTFTNGQRVVSLPPSINDPCEFSIEQLRFLRKEGAV